MNIEDTISVNGSEYEVVIHRSGDSRAPLFIYINGKREGSTFGGYVYSIKDRANKVYQVTLKTGDCEDMASSLGNLMCKKYAYPNYCNVNGVDAMDYNFVLYELNVLMGR
ncbi:hypothetical protein PSN45_002407 [Yamadazyma tenuis]|uniref:uncharacterized protein n=1 Tax=Candida tenuis TaxID=2315449 RepID=UPI0027A1DBB7|nr:hypothetical protein PSN45_002407 [Yamadazyma tenuis]